MSRSYISLVIFTLLLSCGRGGQAIVSLLCGIGHDQSSLTLGLNLDELAGLGLLQDDGGISNEDVKNFLNESLTGFVEEDVLRIKSVETAHPDDETDSVRFIQLSGSFSGGFGVAAQFLKGALSSAGLAGESVVDFLHDSFSVSAASQQFNFTKWLSQTQKPWERHHLRRESRLLTPQSDQWALLQTNYSGALDHLNTILNKGDGASDSEVIVAVLDTGVDKDHPDLQDILIEGYDAVGTDTGTDDENGHGTHCAGIIAAQAKTSDTSPEGVAAQRNIKIMPIKVLDSRGAGGFQAIEKGIRYAMRATPKPDVLSLSLGAGLEYGDLDEDTKKLSNELFKEAIEKYNMIVVVAAGNESCPLGGNCRDQNGIFPKSIAEYVVLPCMYEEVICVGASNPDETLADYSNYSAKKDASYRTKAHINAPGTDIYSTWPVELGSYKTISGTSMATPYVAGIAALFKSVRKDLNQQQFLEILQAGQVNPSDMVEKSEVGRLDLYKATVAFGINKSVGLGVEAPVGYQEPGVNPVTGPNKDNTGQNGANFNLWSAICQ